MPLSRTLHSYAAVGQVTVNDIIFSISADKFYGEVDGLLLDMPVGIRLTIPTASGREPSLVTDYHYSALNG